MGESGGWLRSSLRSRDGDEGNGGTLKQSVFTNGDEGNGGTLAGAT